MVIRKGNRSIQAQRTCGNIFLKSLLDWYQYVITGLQEASIEHICVKLPRFNLRLAFL